MMKWKAGKETINIGTMELGNVTLDEDNISVFVDICDMSDSLKAVVNKAVEKRKVDSVSEWEDRHAKDSETPFKMEWSSKPPVIDDTYLWIFLKAAGRSNAVLRLLSMMQKMSIWVSMQP